ncbi:MAG: tetratricopeptide repeat protein [Planctomycetales bacterium]
MNEQGTFQPRRRPLAWRRWAILTFALTTTVGGVFLVVSDSPRRLMEQGRLLLGRDPLQAERLLVRSIQAAGGDYPEAQLLHCRALAAQQRWPAAAGGFSLIHRPEQCDPQDLVALARDALQHGVPLLADMCLKAAPTVGPHRADVLRLLLPLHLQEERLREALHDGRELAELAPQDPLPWRVMATAHRMRHEPALAIDDLRQALERSATGLPTDAIRGELVDDLLETGDLAEARRQLDLLLAGADPVPEAHVRNGHLLRLEGRPEDALQAVERALVKRRGYSGALYLRGTLRFDLGQPEQAESDLEAVVRLMPFNGEAHYKLAQILRKLGRETEADEHQRRSREISQAELEIATLKEQLAKDRDNRELASRLAELLEKIGRQDEAERVRTALERLGEASAPP